MNDVPASPAWRWSSASVDMRRASTKILQAKREMKEMPSRRRPK